jgi:pimeloyl-ACP methyl ester carboxylesterase
MKRLCCALAVLMLAAHTYANPLDHGDLVTFATRDGVTQSIFVESLSSSPAWVVVLFGGTPGALHLDATGATTLKGNFLIRSAHHWIDRGDAVVLADAPSDHAPGVDDLFRHGKESFADTQAIVAKVRERFPTSKIALVGTSAGTVSVGNALERDPNIADAFVLTSPVTVSRTGGGATISDELAAATPAVEEVCRLPPFRLSEEKVDQRGN